MEGRIVELAEPCNILIVPFWDKEYHPLSCACQKDPISVFEILSSGSIVHILPSSPPEVFILPMALLDSKVSIPGNAGPVQLKALNVKLSGNFFEKIGRPDIVFVI